MIARLPRVINIIRAQRQVDGGPPSEAAAAEVVPLLQDGEAP